MKTSAFTLGKWRLLALILGIAFPGTSRAQLVPEQDNPYFLRVVLHCADNRFLTQVFQEQLQRSLRDHLQLSLGKLARVDVVRAHPLLREIEAKGLENGLEGWEEISNITTHFVLVDFAAGMYTLKARQYDGLTGLMSPAPRQAQTSDRGLVAQTAARLVEQDFGLVGTVVEATTEVKLALKGGNLVPSLERWVKPGDVFAISRITRRVTKEGERLLGTRVPWALLEVKGTRDGFCHCRLWNRFQQDNLRDLAGGVLGYRCLKLATITGPLKLQLIDDEQFRPGLQVHVLKPGEARAAEELTTNRNGLVTSRDSYRHMVLVRVLSGKSFRQIPVELTGDRTVVCRLKIQADAEDDAALEFRKDQWVRRLLDNLLIAAERVAGLNAKLNQSMKDALESMKDALDTVRDNLKTMESEVEQMVMERAQILRQAGDKTKLDLQEGDLALGALQKRRKDLEAFVLRIDERIKESTSPATLALNKMVERAYLLEGEAEFDQAIALYEKVLEISPDQTKVKGQLAKLKTAWATKDDRHAQARGFLVETWPKLEVRELEKNLDKALAELAVCTKAQDRLTPLKVIRANEVHTANLSKYLDTLKRKEDPDSRSQRKIILQVVSGLRRLQAEAVAAAEKATKD